MPSELRELLRRFYELASDPHGAAHALGARGLGAGALSFIKGSPALSPLEHLEIYARAYRLRLMDALAEDYPKLAGILGEERFHALVRDYLCACPPAHPSLGRAGARLAGFIATEPFTGERADLADLARLEWARVEVFDEADATTLALSRVKALEAGELAALDIALVPAHRIVESPWAVDEPWLALERGSTLPPARAAERTLVVWRSDFVVFHRPLDEAERALLPLLRRGAEFADVCAALGEGRTLPDAAELAFELLSRWCDEGLLRAG